ncbi:AbrB family transcriptional regulator, partial [Streptococcus pseudopneumoniae]
APKIPDPFSGDADLRMEDDFEGVKFLDSEI